MCVLGNKKKVEKICCINPNRNQQIVWELENTNELKKMSPNNYQLKTAAASFLIRSTVTELSEMKRRGKRRELCSIDDGKTSIITIIL